MHAIILAGGLGTRLRSAVPDVPKAMAPIANEPFLVYLLRYLEAEGLRSATLAIGHRGKEVRRFFGPRFGSMTIDYSVEDEPLGTGGAVRKALMQRSENSVFVVNGDTFVENRYRAMWDFHLSPIEARPSITLLVAKVADAARYGALEIQGERVLSIHEKGVGGQGLINAGAYLLDRELLCSRDFPDRFSLENDWLVPEIEELKPRAFRAGACFIDIGIPEDYERAQTLIPRQLKERLGPKPPPGLQE